MHLLAAAAAVTETQSSSVLMYIHSSLCNDCKKFLKEFAIASKIFEAEGFPRGAMAHMSVKPALVGGKFVMEEFPRVCTDCEPCADKTSPCLWLVGTIRSFDTALCTAVVMQYAASSCCTMLLCCCRCERKRDLGSS
jgi:hypothetical protein